MESNQNDLDRNFDYGSFLPLLLFIIGIYVIFLFVKEDFSQGILTMIFALIVFLLNNLVVNYVGRTSVFNEYLEDMGVLTSFGLSTIVFGLMYYKEKDSLLLAVVLFYSICIILALARNWVLQAKNSVGFPIVLNGVFFPILYYIYLFYLKGPGSSIFILYYIIIGILVVSHINFLKSKEEEIEEIKEKVIEELKEEEFNNTIPVMEENNDIIAQLNKEKEETELKDEEDFNKEVKQFSKKDIKKVKKKKDKKPGFFSRLFKSKKSKVKKDKELGLEYM